MHQSVLEASGRAMTVHDPDLLRRIELERADAARAALEEAALAIGKKHGNQVYMRAWEIAAQIVRSLKP